MTGILYALRTGIPWNAMPKEYGSGKTVHRYFQRWVQAGVFKRMWQAGLAEYDEVKGIAWKWQAGDGAMTKAPLGGEKTGKNPTDRAKRGVKRSLLVDEQGVPLSIVISGANTPDSALLESTLDAMPVERPDPQAVPQNLCLDKAYSGEPCSQVAQEHGYEIHVPDKENAKKTQAQAGPTQAAPLGGRSDSFMAQSLSSVADSLGEEGEQLSVPAVFRLRHHLLAQMRGLEIGSIRHWLRRINCMMCSGMWAARININTVCNHFQSVGQLYALRQSMVWPSQRSSFRITKSRCPIRERGAIWAYLAQRIRKDILAWSGRTRPLRISKSIQVPRYLVQCSRAISQVIRGREGSGSILD
jgi:transposase